MMTNHQLMLNPIWHGLCKKDKYTSRDFLQASAYCQGVKSDNLCQISLPKIFWKVSTKMKIQLQKHKRIKVCIPHAK